MEIHLPGALQPSSTLAFLVLLHLGALWPSSTSWQISGLEVQPELLHMMYNILDICGILDKLKICDSLNFDDF